jgi:uncharacterized protein DUF6115
MHIDHPPGTNPLVSLVASTGIGFQTELILASIGSSVVILILFVICLAVFRPRFRQLASQIKSASKSTSSLASELEAQALLVRQMSMDLEELRKRVSVQNDSVQSAAPSWASPDLPVNLNRRGQIIRLSRKGKSVAEIAQDLNVAQGEVELLLKVHDLSNNNPESELKKVK